jgi:hypothetical protein
MTILTIGKRFVPTEQIAYVERFDPSTAYRTSNLRKTSRLASHQNCHGDRSRRPRAAILPTDPHFRVVRAGELAQTECSGRVAVQATDSQFRAVVAGELA